MSAVIPINFTFACVARDKPQTQPFKGLRPAKPTMNTASYRVPPSENLQINFAGEFRLNMSAFRIIRPIKIESEGSVKSNLLDVRSREFHRPVNADLESHVAETMISIFALSRHRFWS
jgi:hypothetical protein